MVHNVQGKLILENGDTVTICYTDERRQDAVLVKKPRGPGDGWHFQDEFGFPFVLNLNSSTVEMIKLRIVPTAEVGA